MKFEIEISRKALSEFKYLFKAITREGKPIRISDVEMIKELFVLEPSSYQQYPDPTLDTVDYRDIIQVRKIK